MPSIDQLPTVNASLNALATVLLVLGLVAIKGGRERAHKLLMYAAFGVSVAFLVCYLVYHYHALHVKFVGPPLARTVYLVILFTHIPLAAAVPVLAIITIYLGITDQRIKHRKWAKWTFPIWLYVSITGVVIYLMLYQIYPAPPVASILKGSGGEVRLVVKPLADRTVERLEEAPQ